MKISRKVRSKMKTSNKILFAGAIVPVLLFLGIAVSLRTGFENSVYKNAEKLESKTPVSREYDFKGFSKLFFSGAWDVRIIQGSEYSVKIKAPENIMNLVSIENVEDKLILNQFSGYQIMDSGYALEAEIVMPSPSDITLLGACRLNIIGCRQDYIVINANGATKISVSDTRLTNLNLKGEGIAEWDLSQALIVNTEVDYYGQFSIALCMDGGELKGVLEGMGELTYAGKADTSELKIKNPLSRIVHLRDL